MTEQAVATKVVIVSGYSGAGKTVALRALEDVGFFCIDNLPLPLINSFITTALQTHSSGRIGIGIDIREQALLVDGANYFHELRSQHPIKILFLEAELDILVRRFKETRRPHPLASMLKITNLGGAIEEEGRRLEGLRVASDRIIDTSTYTPHQLRYLISSMFGAREAGDNLMSVSVVSFGFKFGAPTGLDLLFDVRFLPNPYFVQELKPLTGRDPELVSYVMSQPDTSEFLDRLLPLLEFLIPHYIKEGKSYLSIGIGCTGGRHRSPVIAEKVGTYLEEHAPVAVTVSHRDMENGSS